MASSRKQHPPEFKEKVMKELAEGKMTVPQLAAKHGIHNSLIYIWRQKAAGGKSNKLIRPPKGTSVADLKWVKVRHAAVYLKSAVEEWGSAKSQHLASLAMLELREALS